jgi:uncharacterized protein with HEPN domain
MSNRTDLELLGDILEAIRRARLYVADIDYDAFMQDIKAQDAVVRTLEVIGEATKRLSADLRERHPEVPWKNMAGLRDKLIHEYFGVNFDVVWQVVTGELPGLALQVEQILATEI